MTDLNDEIWQDLEYWSALEEDSFRNYCKIENEKRAAKGLNEMFSFDKLREVFDQAKRASRLFLESFDIVIAQIPNVQIFKKGVHDMTSDLRKYLATTSYISSSSFNGSIMFFHSLLEKHLSSSLAIYSNLNLI